jgi:hypothetical protein
MALVVVLARDWTVELRYPDLESDWIPIHGLDTLIFSGDLTSEQISTFEFGGYPLKIASERELQVRLVGKFLEDRTTRERDVGQLACELLAVKIGFDSSREFRLTTPGGSWTSFLGVANMGDVGGGKNDAASWNCEITGQGRIVWSPPEG